MLYQITLTPHEYKALKCLTEHDEKQYKILSALGQTRDGMEWDGIRDALDNAKELNDDE